MCWATAICALRQNSDEVRNDDGDSVVDPPDEWIEAEEDETLDEKRHRQIVDSFMNNLPKN